MAKCFSVSYNNLDKRLDPEFYDPYNTWNSGIHFERYALSLIDALAKKDGKTFFTNHIIKKNGKYVELDGYAPDGISGIEGPLIVEVKLKIIGFNHIKNLIERFRDAKQFKSLLLITKEKTLFDPSRLGVNIILWDYKDLKNLEDRFPEVSYPVTKDVSGAIARWQNVNYKDNRKLLVEEIAANDDLVLFLGAGCSIGDKIPKWDNLLEKLLFEIFNQNIDNEEILNKLKILNKTKLTVDEEYEFGTIKNRLYNSNLTLGRFIKEIFNERFVEETRKSLYDEYKRTIYDNSTLNAISDFIMVNNAKIKAIVTYNFDDLLEFYLRNRKIEHLSIYEGDKLPSNNKLPIYHVHGFLPKDDEVNDESVIFGEKEYHIQYGDPHSWQNMVPLKFLRENTVLFIGLSMDDPNLRRLLDIGYRYFNSPKHYLIYSKDRWKSGDEKISNIFRGMEERTFKDLGLKIVWLKGHNELNEVLKDVTDSFKNIT